MSENSEFDLADFLPYALNRAAEASSRDFQRYYKAQYGMLRTEWRVIFHLGRYGDMTAKRICDLAGLHKTKVSRAVAALEQKRLLGREVLADDRRHERLSLTKSGERVFADLFEAAQSFDERLASKFSHEEQQVLRRCLTKIAAL